MFKKYILLLFILFVLKPEAYANFNFNAGCVEAYQDILSLRMNEARLIIQKEKKLDPQNGITILLDNYADFFSLLSSDSKADYEKIKSLKSSRISALEKNDKNSPYYLFAQAEVYLQCGLLKARFGDYLSSAIDINKANNLLKDNAQRYRDFLPNQKSLGLINVIFGSTPANIKSITRFLGMSGDVDTGIKQLEDFKSAIPKTRYSFYKDEVVFLICYIEIDLLHHTNSYAKLVAYLGDMESKSLLKTYLQGYVAAKTGHNDEAIIFLTERPVSNQYIDMPAIDYLLGNARLNRMDTDAYVYLYKYVKDYKGINYIKDSYLKLAYFYLLHNDNEKYLNYLKLVRSEGYATDERDQRALKEANDDRPDIDLLKARFAFDGGYYGKALAQLKNKNVNNFKLLRDKIEFQYRLGRVYDKTEKFDEALINYQKAIYLGKTTTYYYAANAALKMGDIFAQKKDYTRAANFYHQAIDMKNHQDESGISNEARQSLKRINR